MAYTTINKSTDYFNTKLYTGNGTTDTAQTGLGFQPDFNWTKQRSSNEWHVITDSIRGVTQQLFTNSTQADQTNSEFIKSFDSDGFTVGTANATNQNNQTFTSWNWKANGAGSTNYDGSITSTVSANTTAGFSIVSYTGSTGNYQVGHGLSSAPKVVMVKTRDNARNWVVYHQGMGAGNWIYLNQNYPQSADVNYWNNTNPTNSVFSVSNTNYNENNGNGENYIAYCFAEKTGYSKFGFYTGNGSTDGTFVYTGFKPAFIIAKRTDNTGNWILYDNKRDVGNPTTQFLASNTTGAEQTLGTSNPIYDFLSNGFKLRGTGGDGNASGGNFIYMAFGQSLVGSNNVPCTAR